MEYAVEMGSSVTMMYIPSFVKICSGIQILIGGINRHDGDRIKSNVVPVLNYLSTMP
jgi:hypothetical protein